MQTPFRLSSPNPPTSPICTDRQDVVTKATKISLLFSSFSLAQHKPKRGERCLRPSHPPRDAINRFFSACFDSFCAAVNVFFLAIFRFVLKKKKGLYGRPCCPCQCFMLQLFASLAHTATLLRCINVRSLQFSKCLLFFLFVFYNVVQYLQTRFRGRMLF